MKDQKLFGMVQPKLKKKKNQKFIKLVVWGKLLTLMKQVIKDL